jgi:hypothetical protein
MALLDRVYSHIPSYPDASIRRPLTPTDIALVVLFYYAHAVMAILPGTFSFRVALLPFTLWTAWSSAVSLDVAQYLVNILGITVNPLRIAHLNFVWVVSKILLESELRFYIQWLLPVGDVGHSPQVFRMDIYYQKAGQAIRGAKRRGIPKGTPADCRKHLL